MKIYGYEEILNDKVNAVFALKPGWSKIDCEDFLAGQISSCGIWDKPFVGRKDELYDEAVREVLQAGELEFSFKSEGSAAKALLVYKNNLGLINFLRRYWRVPKEKPDWQAELETFISKDISPGQLDHLETLLAKELHGRGRGRKKRRRYAYDAHNGFIKEDNISLQYLTLGRKRWAFYEEGAMDGQIILKESQKRINGVEVPVNQALWDAGSSDSRGPIVSFVGGRHKVHETLNDLNQGLLGLFDEGAVYAWSPFSLLQGDSLSAIALIRLPSAREAARWLGFSPETVTKTTLKLFAESRQNLPESWRRKITAIKLTDGLPAAGFLKDSRDLIHLPQNIQVITDSGEALAILARINHDLFLGERLPKPTFSGLDLDQPLWAVLCTPKAVVNLRLSSHETVGLENEERRNHA